MANFFDLIGRIMISAIFLFSGINKIFNYDGTVGWMEGFGIPGFLLIPAIVIEILFPLMVIVGYQMLPLLWGETGVFCDTIVMFKIWATERSTRGR